MSNFVIRSTGSDDDTDFYGRAALEYGTAERGHGGATGRAG